MGRPRLLHGLSALDMVVVTCQHRRVPFEIESIAREQTQEWKEGDIRSGERVSDEEMRVSEIPFPPGKLLLQRCECFGLVFFSGCGGVLGK